MPTPDQSGIFDDRSMSIPRLNKEQDFLFVTLRSKQRRGESFNTDEQR
jgi:hypothetical protein